MRGDPSNGEMILKWGGLIPLYGLCYSQNKHNTRLKKYLTNININFNGFVIGHIPTETNCGRAVLSIENLFENLFENLIEIFY